MQKAIWLTNKQPLHTELSSSDRTGFVLLVPASLSKASQSGSDGDCMWAKTHTPCFACIAPGSYTAFQWCGRKHCPEPQTRSHLGPVAAGVPDEPLPPDAVYAMDGIQAFSCGIGQATKQSIPGILFSRRIHLYLLPFGSVTIAYIRQPMQVSGVKEHQMTCL